MKKPKTTIYIILPVYNEGGNLIRVISEIRQTLAGQNYKIVAVDDGSRDRSAKILQKIKSTDITIITHQVNMNIGAVFSDGLNYVLDRAGKQDVVVIMEADNTSSINILENLIAEITIGKNQIAIASRFIPGGCYRNFPAERLITSRLANFLMKKLFPIGQVTDYTIFFRSYSAETLQKLRSLLGRHGIIQSKGFLANAELLVKLSCLTNRISEVPFVYDYGFKKGGSKLGIVNTAIEYMLTVPYLNQIKLKLDKL